MTVLNDKQDLDLASIIQATATEALGNMVFLELIPSDALPAEAKPMMISAVLPFSLPFPGCLSLSVSRDLLLEMVENIYSRDPEGEEAIAWEVQADTLTELLNTVGGMVLKEITPSDTALEMGLPRIAEPAEIKTEACHRAECLFEVEGRWLTISLVKAA